MEAPERAARERRRNYELRELLEELLFLSRTLARKHSLMTREELTAAEERITWLAEQVYRAAIEPVRLVPERPLSAGEPGHE